MTRILDLQRISGNPLTWNGIIRIVQNGKHRDVRRTKAFQFGLAEGVPEFTGKPPVRSELIEITFKIHPDTVKAWGGVTKINYSVNRFLNQKP